ncbi:MAG: glycosyltransferase [Oscillatoriales cyanobacterium SM2_1_8]|nr:glycosyltransferase [Oscillatoriales cyanobacterium SM2_1_8]
MFAVLILLAALFGVATLWLLLYGLNAYWLTAACRWGTPRPILSPTTPSSFALVGAGYPESAAGAPVWPVVTVQLPIFNERYVAERLLAAVCRLDYPALHVQVLDDSTDDTQAQLQGAVAHYRDQGVDIDYLHRSDRTGFKAGALQAALAHTKGDYIAIFDADFLPSPDWLKRAIAPYLARPQTSIAVVQTRWGHVNSAYSLLTQLQAVGIDGHFAIEQRARCEQGYFLNFNGTAGLWYKPAILDAGGWQHDTLAEDMDLSYRAQLAGWQVVYDNDTVAPAELPVTMAALKLQQFRWAKGSIQCARKLLGRLGQAAVPGEVKWQAFLHLTGYLAHLWMVTIAVLALPLLGLLPPEALPVAGTLSSLWFLAMVPATLGPPFLYFSAQQMLDPAQGWRKWPYIVWLAVLGTGLSANNGRAVLSGLFGQGATFRRTPKFGLRQRGDRWADKVYRLPWDWAILWDWGLCAWSGAALVLAWQRHLYIDLPLLGLYVLGYGYVGTVSLWQAVIPATAPKAAADPPV